MSIVTLAQYKAAASVGTDSDSVLYGRLAGMTKSLERYCNRAFAWLVSAIEADGTGVKLTVPQHGFKVGQVVRLASTTDGLSGDVTITARTVNTFTFANAITQAQADALIAGDEMLSVRPIRKTVKSTRGGDKVYLDPRPIAAVTSAQLGTETLTASTDYVLADIEGDLSYIGEVALKTATWPVKAVDCLASEGATLEFVSGEEFPPASLRQAALSVLSNLTQRQSSGEFQSESYEDYSYTKRNVDQIGKLFGEADFDLEIFRLPVI